MKNKKTVRDLSDAFLKGKRVLLRADLNVPMDGKVITDDTRIRASIPTMDYLISKGAIVAVCSHLGRPKVEGYTDEFCLGPCAIRLGELMGKFIPLATDCVGDAVDELLEQATEGDVILLENTRFHKAEEKNEEEFSRILAKPFDLYVNDAFGSAHRAHASTAGVVRFLQPAVAGFLMEKELEFLVNAIENGTRPLAAIIGGAKISTKITVLEKLLDQCDKLTIGGGMAFTFLKAQGYSIGSSLCEEDYVPVAKRILEKAKEHGKSILLPLDLVVADKFAADADTQIVGVDEIPSGWMGLDIGPLTIKELETYISDCKTIVMNGPMGVFEFEKFSKGTLELIQILATMTQNGALTIIGGGDSVAAVEISGKGNLMTHISTGGGASLELLEGKLLPGVEVLDDKV